MQIQKYTIKNPPALNSCSFIIEQDFLRHIKTGVIPNLDKYLATLNHYDWTCLLAMNPRKEFLEFLDKEMVPKLDWKYILECELNRREEGK